ncbi:unnamed protein product [Parajaminaea phylloscopi]
MAVQGSSRLAARSWAARSAVLPEATSSCFAATTCVAREPLLRCRGPAPSRTEPRTRVSATGLGRAPSLISPGNLIPPIRRAHTHAGRSPPSDPPQASQPSSSAAAPRRRSRLLTLLALALGGGITLYIIDENFQARTLQRNLLTAYTGISIALDYKLHFDRDDPDAVAGLHERCADRLFSACEKNQGLYIKIGQAVGANSLILPAPYHKFTRMFDDVERMPWDVVEKVVREELAGKGKTIDDVFSDFERQPIAAASVAQVHRATLRETGQTVAVKVQRPSIRSQSYWDLLCFRILLKFYERIFDLPLSYFGGYISNQIELETHFEAELKNSMRIKKHIDADKSLRNTVTVPEVYPSESSDRMLVMEWIDGACKMTDRDRIESMGLSVRKVASDVCNVFAAMIFQYGFVQADGHAGNVLIRKHPTNPKSHQVVLIDHGLYVELSDKFRQEYAQLWKAIFTVDLGVLERITRDWGMGQGSSELFASATLMRPWSNPKKHGGASQTEEEKQADAGLSAEELRKKRHQERMAKQKEVIKNFLERVELVPKELIFVGRSMRIVQANNQTLGSPVNRINILARHAADALVTTSPTQSLLTVVFPPRNTSTAFSARLSQWLSSRMAFVRFRGTLLVLDIAFFTSTFLHWCSALLERTNPLRSSASREEKRRRRGRGFEDDLEESMQRLARDELGVELRDEAFEG